MQRFSKKDLQPQAEKFMKAHGVDTFLATEDGNFFHPKDKSLAHDHNAKNVKGEVIEFSTIENGKVKSENDEGSIMHIITQEDLDNNEGLSDIVNVGDEVGISEFGNFEPLGTMKKEEEVINPAPISEDVERHGEPVPAVKPKADPKPKAKPSAKAKK